MSNIRNWFHNLSEEQSGRLVQCGQLRLNWTLESCDKFQCSMQDFVLGNSNSHKVNDLTATLWKRGKDDRFRFLLTDSTSPREMICLCVIPLYRARFFSPPPP
jgi:hypothetical protein